jgi:hypothetical protein
MSQSSIEVQAKELEDIGIKIQRGARFVPTDKRSDADKKSLAEAGSQMWVMRWAKNAAKNYAIVSKSFGIRFLSRSCQTVPAFVVGVAPSLDDDILLLKQAVGRSIIIATDASLRALLANGIRPDLVVSYDCKQEQKLLWESIDDKTLPMLFNSCTHPDSIASWPGPILFYNQYHQQDELCHHFLPGIYPELGQIPSTGTVGNMAILAAHAMGCSPIMAVGMDFCLKPMEKGWKYRAQDYRFQDKPATVGAPPCWEKSEIKVLYDNDERSSRSFNVTQEDKEYRTDPELALYLDAFTSAVGAYKVPVVNCSPNGMIPKSVTRRFKDGSEEVQDIERITLSDAILKYCPDELQGGRHIIPYLSKIVPDPRKL